MRGDEDDRHRTKPLDEQPLQVEAIQSGEAHVENGARGAVDVRPFEEVFGRVEACDAETGRFDQPLDRPSKQFVVVDDRD